LKLSIIVPAHNAGTDISECLGALKAAAESDTEIIVVDDASTDDTLSTAQRAGVAVFNLERNSGPAAARNYGARQARGDILFFVDADVVIAPDALQRVKKAFAKQSKLAAVFGSYDDKPRAQGMASQYRNLLHHYVHQNGNPEASTFWAGCGAIRRSVFEEVGGFDEERFPRPSIEDIELGYRLRQLGHRILLDKSLQGTHLKQWKLFTLLRTDIFGRALPWSRLILESRNAPDDLNLKVGQRVSFAFVALACFFLPLGLIWPAWLAVSAAALLGVVGINRHIYAFFFQKRGIAFAARCVPLHLLYYLYSGLTYFFVWLGFRIGLVAATQPFRSQRL
jgi:glycosyltransferase involved in cell wall biosynthesis